MRGKAIALVCLIVAIALIFLSAPKVSAGPRASIYYIKMSTDPPVVGKDAPITLMASVEFGGACCYTVYVRNATAQLTLPAGMKLVSGKLVQPLTSPGQNKTGRVAAQAAGKLTKFPLSWTLTGDDFGEYRVKLQVMGYTEGTPDLFINKSGEYLITVAKSIVVSAPAVVPGTPVVSRDTYVLANVSSAAGSVRDVMLNYSFDNRTWRSVRMDRTDEYDNSWVGKIPRQSSETAVYYYIYSLDSLNHSVKTGVYGFTIKNYATQNSAENLESIILLSSSAIGAAAIASIYFAIVVRGRRKGITDRGRAGESPIYNGDNSERQDGSGAESGKPGGGDGNG